MSDPRSSDEYGLELAEAHARERPGDKAARVERPRRGLTWTAGHIKLSLGYTLRG